jgi:hypothetical protein
VLSQLLFLKAQAGPKHNGGGEVLSQRGMGHGKSQGLIHSRMEKQCFIHTARDHFFAATVDHFLETAR